MTWNISASGTKQQCLEAIEPLKHFADQGDATAPDQAADVAQFEETKHAILDEIDDYPDGAPSISVSASGHAPGPNGGSRYVSVSISGSISPS